MANLILITGAAGTVGQATAKLLAKKGYELFLIDKNAEQLAKFAEKIPKSNWQAVDINDSKAISEIFNKVSKKLYGAVLCAGIRESCSPLEECSEEEFIRVINTNIVGTWLCMKNALRVLKSNNNGVIIALTSISGTVGTPLLSAYCASKHAIQGLVKTASREAAACNVRVNAVAPGPIESAMMAKIDHEMGSLLSERKNAKKNIPLQRYASPDEVANMIAFLCSNESSYCTGATMFVDGGFTCR